MPTLTAFADHPTHPYVRLEANWADTPSVESLCVYRVNKGTGERKALRSYVCSDDDGCLVLSCGHGIWWDTEAPLDTEIFYVAESADAPCAPAAARVLDSYTRTLAADWGSTDTGQPWNLSHPAQFSVNGSRGVIEMATDSVNYTADLDTGTKDQLIDVEVVPQAAASGDFYSLDIIGRWTDSSNFYAAAVMFEVSGNIELLIYSMVGGAFTVIGSAVVAGTYAPGDIVQGRFQVWGDQLKAKAWNTAVAEPVGWQIEITDTDLTTGVGAGVNAFDASGVLPLLDILVDDFAVSNPCDPCVPVTVQTAPLTVPSNGMFWLSDPVRPCHDRPVKVCSSGLELTADCGGSGIQFSGIGTELYASNGFRVRPAQRRRPIAITRPRQDAATVLRLLTATFTDRDDLLQLLIPGSPLLFRGPPQFGVPDRYMDIDVAAVTPGLPDLRQQGRTEALPYETVDCPAGPTQGICGNRVKDLCDVYSSWDEMAAAGLTFDDLLTGRATGLTDPRTWDDVQAEFADWNAVQANGTWTELQVGD